MEKTLKVTLSISLAVLFLYIPRAFAGDEGSPWSWRVDFVGISPSGDFNPIDSLLGGSLDVLHDFGSDMRLGGEIQWVTGNRKDNGTTFKTDWATLLAVAEYSLFKIPGNYSFLQPSAYDYDIYLNLGVGAIYVDSVESSPGVRISEDDTTFAIRGAVGANIRVYEHVSFNVQAGYIWSKVDLGGTDLDSAGFEGKIGATVTY